MKKKVASRVVENHRVNHVFVNASPVINHDVLCLPAVITGGVPPGLCAERSSSVRACVPYLCLLWDRVYSG